MSPTYLILLLGLLSTHVETLRKGCIIGVSGLEAIIRPGNISCFKNEGFSNPLPKKQYGWQQLWEVLRSLIEKDPEMWCRNTHSTKRAFNCFMKTSIECLPGRYMYPNLRTAPELLNITVDRLCDNHTAINFDCINNHSSEFFDCLERNIEARPRRTTFMSYPDDVVCKSFGKSLSCQREAFESCGCHTLQIYTNITMNYVIPPDCPKLQKIPLDEICSASRFRDNIGHVLSSLLISIILVTLMSK